MRWKSDREDEFFYLKLLLAAAVVILIVAGLIEWNAKRQAAAMTRELLRRPTEGELAQIREMQLEVTRQAQTEAARSRRQLGRARSESAVRLDARPLASDERCIDGQRLRRLENGWQEIGTCLKAPTSKRVAYYSAIADAIRREWIRPDNLSRVFCPVQITQRPGGEVVSIEVLPSCAYDTGARRNLEAAILKASPLPYTGFEEVFAKTLTIRFRADETAADP